MKKIIIFYIIANFVNLSAIVVKLNPNQNIKSPPDNQIASDVTPIINPILYKNSLLKHNLEPRSNTNDALSNPWCPPSTEYDGANCIVASNSSVISHKISNYFIYNNYLYLLSSKDGGTCPSNMVDEGIFNDGHHCRTGIYIGNQTIYRGPFWFGQAIYITPLKNSGVYIPINVSNRPDWNVGNFNVMKPDGTWSQCTASVVAGNIVVTNAHCVVDQSTGKVFPAFQFHALAFDKYSEILDTVAYPEEFLKGTYEDSKPIYDYAFVKMKSKVTAGWLGIKWNVSDDVLTIISAHSYKNKTHFPLYYYYAGKAFKYKFANSGGSSGSPIIEGYNDSNSVFGNYLVGMHCCIRNEESGQIGIGPVFDSRAAQLYSELINYN